MLTTRVIDAIMRLCATIGIICPGAVDSGTYIRFPSITYKNHIRHKT